VARSEGQPVTAIAPALARLAGFEGGAGGRSRPPARERTAGDVGGIAERFDAWFADAGRSWNRRLTGALRVTEAAASRGLEMAESHAAALVDLFHEEERRPTEMSPGRAGAHDRRLLREMVFTHTDVATFQQRRTGRWGRARRFWKRYRAAAALRRGTRGTPAVHDMPAGIPFAAIEAVGPAVDDAGQVTELMSRYVRTRLQSQTFFGPGFHGWSLTDGLRALWSAALITAWLSRWFAAADRRTSIRLEDAVHALGKVDLATMQLPSVRRTTARWRLEHLAVSGGLLKLAHDYCMVAANG
jgi:hypothetical protein